ncbi:hypothetical protein B5X24_HaOG206104 [Helicoverpa armigera]|uniref:EF-hand domain-containing protein n=1 Tax=Helicoverpa armigera TaxID=29058 RepID=A0A2W1BPC6_HELAM|nr:hypothetical protein B5X24_HaOG206104 [Helicoverpa armigera]
MLHDPELEVFACVSVPNCWGSRRPCGQRAWAAPPDAHPRYREDTGGAFEGVEDQVSPFGYGRGEGVDAGHGDPEWICSKEKPRYDQIFQSLNPIDGKVTGAGTHTLTHLLHTHPHLRGHLVVDKALDALLSAAKSCSLITDLCMQRKDRADTDKEDDHFGKLVNSLSSATENCKLIAQFILNAREARAASTSSHMSPAVSIHSLNDALAIDGAGDRCRSAHSAYNVGGFQTSPNDGFNDDECESVSSSESQSEPPYELNVRARGADCLGSLFNTVKFIVLLALNVVTLFIVVELMFVSLAYVLTGERYMEFYVDKSPRSCCRHDLTWRRLSTAAKTEMVKSKLPNSVLGKIWKLSDIDKDGFLDEDEFALAMHLIHVKIDGHDLPSELPSHLVPPSKRN